MYDPFDFQGVMVNSLIKIRTHLFYILAIAMLVMGLATVSVAQADEASGLETEGGLVWPLNFSFEFCWHSSPCGDTTLTLFQNRTFVTRGGEAGKWVPAAWLPANQGLYLSFNVGCLPLYSFVRTAELNFSGTMACRDGSGGFGTASLVYTP